MKIDDRLVTSRPVNRTAARAMGEGEHYEPNINYKRKHWKAPPVTQPVPRTVLDLRGIKFGHLTVVGLYSLTRWKGDKPRWLVRCVCGDYELRVSEEINDSLGRYEDRCVKCRHKLKLQGKSMEDGKQGRHWKTSPPLRRIPKDTPDLTGIKFGQLTVVGLYAVGTGKYGLWIVRCACGDYETRKARSIKTQSAKDDSTACCSQCRTPSPGSIVTASRKRPAKRHWGDTKPPVIPVPERIPDFTGAIFGQLTVIGHYADCNGQWVVQCDCGSYELRSTKTVRRQNPNSCCNECYEGAQD